MVTIWTPRLPLIFQSQQFLCRNWHHTGSVLAQAPAVAEVSQGRSLHLSG